MSKEQFEKAEAGLIRQLNEAFPGQEVTTLLIANAIGDMILAAPTKGEREVTRVGVERDLPDCVEESRMTQPERVLREKYFSKDEVLDKLEDKAQLIIDDELDDPRNAQKGCSYNRLIERTSRILLDVYMEAGNQATQLVRAVEEHASAGNIENYVHLSDKMTSILSAKNEEK